MSQSGDGDFDQLAPAIEAVSSGDTILVMPGTYHDTSRQRVYRDSTSMTILGMTEDPRQCAIVDLTVFLDRVPSARLARLSFRGMDDGGVTIVGGAVSVSDCRFVDNTSLMTLEIRAEDAQVASCQFRDNAPRWEQGQGGLYLTVSGDGLVSDCIFVENEGYEAAALLAGGNVTVENSVFTRNKAWWSHPYRGIVLFSNMGGLLTNCTFLDNDAAGFGAVMVLQDTVVRNSIIARTRNGTGVACSTGLNPECCCIWGNEYGDFENWCDGIPSDGNFSADPLFCDETIGDVGLREGSPCLPGAHGGRECGLIGAIGRECGLVPTQRLTWGAVKARYLDARRRE